MTISQLLTLMSLLAIIFGSVAIGVFIIAHSVDRSFDYSDLEHRRLLMNDPNVPRYGAWLTYDELRGLSPRVAEQYRDAVDTAYSLACKERVKMMWISKIAAVFFFIGFSGSICFAVSLIRAIIEQGDARAQ